MNRNRVIFAIALPFFLAAWVAMMEPAIVLYQTFSTEVAKQMGISVQALDQRVGLALVLYLIYAVLTSPMFMKP